MKDLSGNVDFVENWPELEALEVLRGFRNPREADWAVSRLRSAHCPELEWNDWRSAADLGRDLAGRGHNLPVTDLVIASLAMRMNLPVYTGDPHFDLISGLRRFSP